MTALLRHLFESSLVAGVFLLAVRCLRNRSASWKHVLLLCAALKFAVPLDWLVAIGVRLRATLPSPAISVPLGFDRIISPSVENIHMQSARLADHIFLSIWLIVAAFFLLGWLRRLLAPIDVCCAVSKSAAFALQRMKIAMGVTRAVKLRESRGSLEPRLCGIFYPTIVLPQTLSERLMPAELDAVILHELAHVRRWDNLTRALVHLLTCVFWFFPLVAWIERQIDAQCELACDELVLLCGARPDEYLDGILKVCQFYILESVAGSSHISGSNLKRRMEYIMSSPTTKASKVSAGIVAVLLFSCLAAALILTGFLTPPRGLAQTAASVTVRAYVTCLFNGADYAEGTVIQTGKGSEQMCVQLQGRPLWVKTSDETRMRSLKLVSLPMLPAPAPFLCTPTAPAGKYCTCKVQGKFSPGAVVNSEKGPLVCSASGGKWRPNKR